VEVLVKVSEEQKLPLFGSSLGHVQQGAIASEGVNEQTEGAQAAIFADQILKGEKKPGEIPVYKFPTNEIYVNPGAAERMGIAIPQEIIDKALVVIQ
jgi:putative ABC transport system substrate-binding protein